MINGLKLTMHGEALKARVAERIGRLEAAGGCEQRIASLTLIRDHIVPGEVYLLDQKDLQFAELLPPPPEPEWPICMGRR